MLNIHPEVLKDPVDSLKGVSQLDVFQVVTVPSGMMLVVQN